MNRMNKMMFGLTAAALALSGTAYAAADAPRMAAKGDGVQTRAEVETRANEMFARLDVTKDGKLDRTDREQARAQKREAAFKRLDTNSDGSISKTEFTAERAQRAPRAERDGDRAGAERRGHHRMRGHHGMRGGPSMMHGRMGGADKDASATQAQFVENALKRFDATDANKDGKVTREERQSAHQAMRAKLKADKPAAK